MNNGNTKGTSEVFGAVDMWQKTEDIGGRRCPTRVTEYYDIRILSQNHNFYEQD